MAAAQPRQAEGRGFFTLYGGWQSGDGTSAQSGSFTVYEETGTFDAAQSFNGGGLLSFGGGVRIVGNLAVGVAYSRATDTQEGTVTVRAPHPLLFNQPRTATATQDGLQHDENVFHLQALYILPVGERFEVIVGGGPSFFAVTHDFITGAGFAESGAPFTTINVANVQVTEADKSVTGFNIGVEAAGYLTRNFGVGGFVRYTTGQADLDSGNGTTQEIDLGGTQVGVGVRVRF